MFIHKNKRNGFGVSWLGNEVENGMLDKDVFINTVKSIDHSVISFFNDISKLREGSYTSNGNTWVRQ